MNNFENLEKFKNNYALNGTAYVEENLSPFNKDEFNGISD